MQKVILPSPFSAVDGSVSGGMGEGRVRVKKELKNE